MLHIQQPHRLSPRFVTLLFIGICFIGIMCYIGLLMIAPKLSIFRSTAPMDVSALTPPEQGANRVIIPALNVNIPFKSGDESVLGTGAWWQYSENGSPEEGGHFVLTANRLIMQATPQQTAEKSYFYHLDQLQKDNPILIDYNGKRFGYKVSENKQTALRGAALDQKSSQPKLTLYTHVSGDEQATVITATPIGEVSVEQ